VLKHSAANSNRTPSLREKLSNPESRAWLWIA
jgi:hypothetical protein